jgi:hypothetical protein
VGNLLVKFLLLIQRREILGSKGRRLMELARYSVQWLALVLAGLNLRVLKMVLVSYTAGRFIPEAFVGVTFREGNPTIV